MDYSEFPTEQKVAYLHNSAVIEMLKIYSNGFDSTKVEQFVQNLASRREREIFSGYLDIYSSNAKKRLSMYEALAKLKKDVGDRNTIHFGGTSCVKIYDIKRFAMIQYFFYYNNHVLYQGFRDLKDFFKPYKHFLSKDEDTSIKIQAIIDSTEDFHKKVILLQLFYQHITSEVIQQKYKDFLSISFAKLPTEAVYDFVFSGWLTPTQKSIDEFLNEILEISRKEIPGVHACPDPVESRLECVYLLHINDIIADISVLKELSEERPHLQFLLDAEGFDYSQVDFSNYMWENFARYEKYMNYFVAHKNVIVPKIQSRIEKEEASEAEKRILYGFLLNGNEVWKI